jgi:deoxyhypusine synthase
METKMVKQQRKLEALELLDLGKTNTIGQIIDGLSRCSFGARMLGEVCNSICEMIQSGNPAVVIYDGRQDSPLGKLLEQIRRNGWIQKVIYPEDYAPGKDKKSNLIVLGNFSQRYEDDIFAGKGRKIFINQARMAQPGQYKDGFFPDVIFTDPTYAVALINLYMDEKINGHKMSVDDEFLDYLDTYGGLAEKVAAGARNLAAMAMDEDCTILMTMSGAMTIAQMGLLICDMIDKKIVKALTTTGAAMAHGLVESMGLKHYKHNPQISDKMLAGKKLNRVTDTLEPEENFDHIDDIMKAVLDGISKDNAISPSRFHREIGKHLANKFPGERGILKSAYLSDVPVFVPAFWDSELGNDIYTYNLIQRSSGKPAVSIDFEPDNALLIDLVQKAKKIGIFTIGGGVPRNWTQNVGPLIELINGRAEKLMKKGLMKKLRENPFMYGLRICPDVMDTGHLSGCTYSEGMSWRKMNPKGSFVEIQADATIVWPFITKYVANIRG